ncbi:MAG: exopolyphosphatase [Defluviitaleaceae bacterium]|nr:exopolyphosphatase [Defluviitaleaceae bacterium]MCL2262823.1 exopolyphosphatase [Defluviitaleaceae bacterium]
MDLLTRSDFDGLACAVLLREIGLIGKWRFVHPKDLQDGHVRVTANDILANVPYVAGCGMWFDHHTSEWERIGKPEGFVGSLRKMDSAARVIYEYFKDRYDLTKFDDMLEQVDKVDAGKLTADDILNPKEWVLLGFLTDPRTGLGRFRDFRISNYSLMEELIDMCRTKHISEILSNPDVKERVELYNEQTELFKEMLKRQTQIKGNVIVTDLRGIEPINAGNRFLIYSLYPEQNISMWIVDGKNKENCSIACGYSVLNRTATVDVGSVLLGYSGGGHKQVGTCQVPYDNADRVIGELVEKLQ